MGKVVRRTVCTRDPEVAKEYKAMGWEVTTELPKVVGGPYHILTGKNLVKPKPKPKKPRSR